MCPFVAGWIERHPDYADLVIDPAVAPRNPEAVAGDHHHRVGAG
jgi:hypothetical protein